MDENPGLKITLKSDRNLPLIFIDQYNLSQAIRNIINNAIEAVSGSGTIAIRVINDKSAKTITFECKDDGIGIPPEDLPLIFQPFYSSKSKGLASDYLLPRKPSKTTTAQLLSRALSNMAQLLR
jgi:signal transduction histidine kinase